MRVVILSGPSGCGKSTFASQLAGNSVICSADDYFTNPMTGEYTFVPGNIGKAHQACLRKFLETVQSDLGTPDVLVVDNTNTTLVEIAPYVRIAEAYGLDVELHAFVGEVHPNYHRVPDMTVQGMVKRHKDTLLADTNLGAGPLDLTNASEVRSWAFFGLWWKLHK